MSGPYVSPLLLGTSQSTITSTGITQASGKLLFTHCCKLVAHAAGGAFILPSAALPGSMIMVLNTVASTFAAAVFPPVAAVSIDGAPVTNNGQINELTANTAFSVPSGKNAIFMPVPDGTGQRWLAFLTA